MIRSAPLKRTGFARDPAAGFSSFTKPRKAMKRTSHKPTVAEGSKYLAACRGEECYLRVSGVCESLGWAADTVVPCHSNQSRHGKAGGRKAGNVFSVPGCGACHKWIDQNRVGTPKQVKFDVWDMAYEMWLPIRERKMGLPEVECAY